MYASKRRQRNFKRVRESNKQNVNLPSNPSKRHRERLNGELETVASLLPYEDAVLQRLDKLSVLRLAVSFLHIKAHFQACNHSYLVHATPCPQHPFAYLDSLPRSVVPSLIDPPTGVPLIDANEPFFSSLAQKALGGFVIILSENAEIYYVTENIETYLGFLQSDVLHQPLFEMIHSEDREDLKQSLRFEAVQTSIADYTDHENSSSRSVVARFRCLLDNTCGFIRVEIKGRFMALHSSSLPTSSAYVPPNHQSKPQKYALVAICTPFVPPIQLDPSMDDPILKTKHSLDLSLISVDTRFRILLELEESGRNCEPSTSSKNPSIYSFIHPADISYASEAHDAVIKYSSSGLMIYRLIGQLSGTIHYMQSSLRLFFKNGKPETIGGNHRLLTEVDGYALLEKRASLKFKYISFDDTLLQSPRIFQGQPLATAAATNQSIEAVDFSSAENNPYTSLDSKDRKPTVKSCSSKSHKSKSKNSQLSKDVLVSTVKPINPPLINCLIKKNVLAPKLTVDAGLVEEVNPFLPLPSQPGCVFSSEASASTPQLPSFWPLSSGNLRKSSTQTAFERYYSDGLELTPYYTHTSAQNGHYPNYLVPANPSEYAIESGFDHSNWALQNASTSKTHHGCPPGTSATLAQPWGDLTTQNAYYLSSSQPQLQYTASSNCSTGQLVHTDDSKHTSYPSSWNHYYTDWIQAGSIQPTSEAKSDVYATLEYGTTRRNEDLLCTHHPQQMDTLLPTSGTSGVPGNAIQIGQLDPGYPAAYTNALTNVAAVGASGFNFFSEMATTLFGQ